MLTIKTIINQFDRHSDIYLYRFGFVEYESVAEAQSVFDKEGDVELDGHFLFIDFAAKRASIDFGGGWEKDLELDESSKSWHD